MITTELSHCAGHSRSVQPTWHSHGCRRRRRLVLPGHWKG